jgi:flagellar hook assembly protein FlgD
METVVLEEAETPQPMPSKPLTVVPNPFNPRTTVKFSVEEASQVTVDVYDVRGRVIAHLHDGFVGAGLHEIIWEGIDTHGKNVSSGVYFIRMTTPKETHHVRAVVLR